MSTAGRGLTSCMRGGRAGLREDLLSGNCERTCVALHFAAARKRTFAAVGLHRLVFQMVRWILARRDSWDICDMCELEPDLFCGDLRFALEHAQPLLSPSGCVGMTRDVPGYRGVDL